MVVVSSRFGRQAEGHCGIDSNMEWIPGYLNEHPVHNSLSPLPHHFVEQAAEISQTKTHEEKGPLGISYEPCPGKKQHIGTGRLY